MTPPASRSSRDFDTVLQQVLTAMKQDNTRRSFLKTTTAGALATGAAPSILGAQKSGSKKLILGSGEYTYEATHDWGQLPDKIKYGNTHGIVEDSQGRVWV